jgi:hypothetical protein
MRTGAFEGDGDEGQTICNYCNTRLDVRVSGILAPFFFSGALRHPLGAIKWEVASGQFGAHARAPDTLAAPRAAEKLRTGSESGVDSCWGGTFATPI